MTKESLELNGWTFAQVPMKAILNPNLSDGAKTLLAYITWRQGTDAGCWPSVPRMAADLGVSEDTIMRRVAELEKAGHLTVTRETGKTNRYTVVADPSQKCDPLQPCDPPQECEGTPGKSAGGTPRKNATHDDSHGNDTHGRYGPSGSRGDHHANAPPSVAQLQSELPQVLADLDDEERNPTAVLVDWIARVSGRAPGRDAYKRVGGMLGNVFGNGRRGKQKAWRIPYREACRQAARLAIEARQGNPEGSFISYLEEVLKEKWSEEQPIDPDRYQQEFGDLLDHDDDWSPPAPILPEGTTKFAGAVGETSR